MSETTTTQAAIAAPKMSKEQQNALAIAEGLQALDASSKLMETSLSEISDSDKAALKDLSKTLKSAAKAVNKYLEEENDLSTFAEHETRRYAKMFRVGRQAIRDYLEDNGIFARTYNSLCKSVGDGYDKLC